MFSTRNEVGDACFEEPIACRIEEDIHLAWCERRKRPLWEHATFTLRCVKVTGGGLRPRTYGPCDLWLEPCSDPREDYTVVGGTLKRHAEPDRDYDADRHAAIESAHVAPRPIARLFGA